MIELFDNSFLRKLELLGVMAKKVRRGERAGRHATQQRGASVEFVDHRSYSPGDDLRYLDWNVYARLGTLFTKQFSSEENINLKVFLDCSRSMAFGAVSKFDFARQLTAALVYIGLSQFERVEVIPFAGGRRMQGFVASSPKSFLSLLQFLSDLPCEGETQFRESFESPLKTERGKRVGFFLSDFLDTEGYQFPLRRLRMQRVALTGLHILDPLEWNPAKTGNLQLRDTETGAMMRVVVNQDTLLRYRKGVQEFSDRLQRTFLSEECRYQRVITSTPLEDVIMLSLRRAGVLTGAGS